jgi:Zn-finger nucleic acid-binding protein
MTKYLLICPDCGTNIVTAIPEAVMWELCPGCYRHGWDLLDVKMAEQISGQSGDDRCRKHANGTFFNNN